MVPSRSVANVSPSIARATSLPLAPSSGGLSLAPSRALAPSVHSTHQRKLNNSTKDPGQKVFSFNIGLGQVIRGWDEVSTR